MLALFGGTICLAAAEDANEPNNSQNTAIDLALGSHALYCANDDWFRLANLQPGLLRVGLTEPGAGATNDLIVYIYNSNGDVLTVGGSGVDDAVLLYQIQETGTYFVRVQNHNGGANSYTLSLAREHSAGGDDANEPDDWYGAPRSRSLPVSAAAQVLADPDWSSIVCTAGTYNLTVTNGATPVTVGIYNQAGALLQLLPSMTSGTVTPINLASDSTLHIAFRTPDGIAYSGGAYSWTLARSIASDDAKEENDTLGTPVNLTAGTHTNLVALDDDYYRLASLKPGLLHVRLEHPDQGAGRDLNMTVLKPDGTVVTSDNRSNATEEVFAHIVTAGDYIVRVFRTNGGDNTYTLTVGTSYAAADDDGREQDDEFGTSVALAPRTTISNLRCRDEDWFHYDAAPGTLQLQLTYDANIGDLSVEAFNENMERIGLASGDTGRNGAGRQLTVDLATGGRVRFAVIGRSGVTYAIRLFNSTATRYLLPTGLCTNSQVTLHNVLGDSRPEILVGTRRYLDAQQNEIKPAALVCLSPDGAVLWTRSFPAIDSADPITGKTYTTSTVSTRPVVADINGDGQLEVVVGVGAEIDHFRPGTQNIYGPGDKGAFYAVSATDGSILWSRTMRDTIGASDEEGNTTGSDGIPDGILSTPVVADMDHDGYPEVGWGSWDQHAYLVDGRTGQDKGGWPVNLHDTTFAAPLIVDVDGDGLREMFLGSAITANSDARTQTGGVLHAWNARGQDIIPGFREFMGTSFYKGKFHVQPIDSSVVAADLTGDGLPEILHGSGMYYPDPTGAFLRVWRNDGTLLYDLATNGRIYSTPLVADLDGNGSKEIIVCTVLGWMHAWNSQGTQLWAVRTYPQGGTPNGTVHPIFGTPISADFDGDGNLEIYVAQGVNIVVVNSSGQQVIGPERVGLYTRYSRGTPAIGDLNGDNYLDLVAAGTGDDGQTGAIYVFNPFDVSSSNASNRIASRMFRDDAVQSLPAVGQNRRTQVQNLITRFYQNVLGREPETAGLGVWVDHILDGRRDGRAVAQGFILSQEFLNRNTSNEQYVDILYAAFFGRAPDTAGRNGHLALLATAPVGNAAKRAEVLEGFITGQEFYNLTNSFNVTANLDVTQGFNRVRVEELVKLFYLGCFERTADAGGLAAWTDALLRKQQYGSDVAQGFTNSQEFLNRQLDDTEYIKALYRAFFGRPADAQGLATWQQYIGSHTRAQVLQGFIQSQEFVNLCNSYGIIPYLPSSSS
jgi:hypothetical protein